VRSVQGNFSTSGLQGFDLENKTIGIIGGGRIGLHVARIAKGFGMHVRVYDINQDNFLAELINFKYVTLDEELINQIKNKYIDDKLNSLILEMNNIGLDIENIIEKLNKKGDL
jgi:D-lactate dehydrogenase